MRPKEMENLAVFSVRKESSSSGKGERRVFLCRRTVRVKVIPASFLKTEGGCLLGRKTEEGQLVELVGDQNPGPQAPPMSKIERERMERRRCQERSDCQWSDEKG